MRSQLRAQAPDAAILLTNSLRSALTMRLCGVRRIYGYRRQGRGVLLTGGPTASPNGKVTPIPMGRYYLEICRWLGLDVPQQPKTHAVHRRGAAPTRRRASGEIRHRRRSDFVIGLTPGASFGSSKCWPAEYFAEMAELVPESVRGQGDPLLRPRRRARSRRRSWAGAKADHRRPYRRDRSGGPQAARETLQPVHHERHGAAALRGGFRCSDCRPHGIDRSHVTRTRTRSGRSWCEKISTVHPATRKCVAGQHECMTEIRPAEVLAAAERLLSGCR